MNSNALLVPPKSKASTVKSFRLKSSTQREKRVSQLTRRVLSQPHMQVDRRLSRSGAPSTSFYCHGTRLVEQKMWVGGGTAKSFIGESG
jgi:hypothetical protein